MYLKSLTLKGFKSFASATQLNFEPGITCVVGPNGSGKSNVVDALSWVMGEQGAKSLRGGKMEDFIFAGTTGRAPLGRAEVTVTIDNTDGTLPIEYTEVSISRILFRNGNSEYQINGQSARLLDVQELLSDSGIGREMHVIVGQGQLDAILLGRPEDRRAFIEEAAGVLKHRKRKEKALRKLDAMKTNFDRIQDLTAELSRQLKPLGKQAEFARKAGVIQSSLRDSKLRLFADEVVQLQSEMDADLKDENSLRFKKESVDKELSTIRNREDEINSLSQKAAQILSQSQERYYQLTNLREKFRSLQKLAAERAKFLSEESETARSSGSDPDKLEAEAAALRIEEKELRTQLSNSKQEVETLGEKLKQIEIELKNEEARIAAAIRANADAREGSARKEGTINGLRAKIETTNSETSRLQESKRDAQVRLENFRQEFTVLESQIVSFEGVEPALDSKLESAKAELKQAENAVKELHNQETDLAKLRSGLEGRLQALQESALHKDGSEKILNDASGITHRGRLASFISVEPGWEKAVALALGTLSESVVVNDITSAVTALTFLKKENAGQSEIFVTAGLGLNNGLKTQIPNGEKSLAAYASSDKLPELVSHLLGDFIAAQDLAHGQQIVNSNPNVIVITRDGDLISSWRAKGGSESGNSLIEINVAIKKTHDELEATSAQIDSLQQEIAKVNENLIIKRQIFDKVMSEVTESDAALSAITESIAVAGQNVKSASDELARLENNLLAVSSRLSNFEKELETILAAQEEPVELIEPDVANRDSLRNQVEEIRAAHVDYRLALRSLEEKIQSISNQAIGRENAAHRERINAANAIKRRAFRATAAVTAQAIAQTAFDALVQIEHSIAGASAERERFGEEHKVREEEIQDLRARNRELSAESELLTSSVHKDEMVRTEIRLRLQSIHEKVSEEFSIDSEQLINEYGPENEVPTIVEDDLGNFVAGEPIAFNREQQRKKLAKAERDLAQLGKINMGALEMYNETEARLKHLTEELKDLRQARSDLMQVVKEVDDKVQEIFKEAFEDTAREFKDIFGRLFPGGDGRLILTDPDDWNTTGVDVEARPPGKRVKRLSLLSGGEKSLVAVAMLVAIFKARPSPFYVMDEVEAALDDTNLSRLLGVFEELREKSQLIVITHQKRSMEIADALYGVTMRGDGVSEVISQRLRESETV